MTQLLPKMNQTPVISYRSWFPETTLLQSWQQGCIFSYFSEIAVLLQLCPFPILMLLARISRIGSSSTVLTKSVVLTTLSALSLQEVLEFVSFACSIRKQKRQPMTRPSTPITCILSLHKNRSNTFRIYIKSSAFTTER